MIVVTRSVSFRAALALALTGVVAVPCAAREAHSPFLPLGRQADAPRGFVAMCQDAQDFCSATPVKADDGMVTAALADDRAIALVPFSSASETRPGSLGMIDAMRPVEHPLIPAPMACDAVRIPRADGFGNAWAGLGAPAACGAYSRPAGISADMQTGRCSSSSVNAVPGAEYDDGSRLSLRPCKSASSRFDWWPIADRMQTEDDRAAVTIVDLRLFPSMNLSQNICPENPLAALVTASPPAPAPAPTVEAVLPIEAVATAVTGDPMKLLKSVNRYVNGRVRQRTDLEIYGRDELWVRSGVGRGASGDCEDIAIEKRYELIARGFPPARLSFAVVYSTESGLHTVLIAHVDDGDLVLDSRSPYIRRWSDVAYSWVSIQSTADPMVWRQLA